MVNNPYQLLDDILDCYKENRLDNYFENHELVNLMRDRGVDVSNEMHWNWMRMGLNRLVKEEYLESLPLKGNPDSDIYEETLDKVYYRLTFEGELLINDGGYVKMMDRKFIQNQEVSRIRKDLWTYNRHVRNLTVWIAVGTIVVGLYTLLQILDWLHCHHYFYYSVCKKCWVHF